MVEQRTDHDCVFCCLAMALGLTYEQAEQRAGAAFMALLGKRGCSGEMEEALYAAFGLAVSRDYVDLKFSLHWASIGFVRNILWGRRALLTVRSKNIPDGMHMIYWDGKQVLDPRQADKQRYTDWNEVEPLEMVILAESPR